MSVMFERVAQCEVRSIVDFQRDPSNKQITATLFLSNSFPKMPFLF